VIRTAWRSAVRFLGSALFATWLLVVVGVWSMLATFIPQGVGSNAGVAGWASAHPALEAIVRALGLHQAFTSPLFIVSILALGLSTGLCAWQRTRAAIGRTRTLHCAALADARSVSESHDLEILCDPALSRSAVLSIASETLEDVGIKTKRREDLLSAVSARWTAWGSPVFHWALLGLVVALLVGNLLRSQGLMGVAVGQTKPDTASSYGIFHAGPLHDSRRAQRGIRVDAFEPDFKTGGVGRGPTPTVALVDRAGKVIKTQRVYPNHTLKSGPLTIYPSGYGLAAIVSVADASGNVVGRGVQLVDFFDEATGTTRPVGTIAVPDSSGKQVYAATFTVPLDQDGAQWLRQVPSRPSARVVVTSADGRTVLDRLVAAGETLDLPGSDSLRLDAVTYYARLQVVDDWTVPLLYAGLFVAALGLSVAALARQQIVLVTAVEGPDGVRLVAQVRLFRGASTSRSEIESELVRALGMAERGSMTA
jgi:cytochrome c biogenesis protein ResB